MIPRCDHCGEAIGMYESAHVVLADGSRLSVAFHERCYRASLAEQPDRG
jgi:hypothetical protein